MEDHVYILKDEDDHIVCVTTKLTLLRDALAEDSEDADVHVSKYLVHEYRDGELQQSYSAEHICL